MTVTIEPLNCEIRSRSIAKRIFRRDEALKLRAEGMSWRSVAKALNSMSTVIDACSEIPPKGRRR